MSRKIEDNSNNTMQKAVQVLRIVRPNMFQPVYDEEERRWIYEEEIVDMMLTPGVMDNDELWNSAIELVLRGDNASNRQVILSILSLSSWTEGFSRNEIYDIACRLYPNRGFLKHSFSAILSVLSRTKGSKISREGIVYTYS